jgi:3-phenylpropionate/trans-cinnamate dioxygenase ferredoxin subunit
VSKWTPLPQRFDFQERPRAFVLIDGRSIALFRVDDTIYAIDDTCPHNGASLVGGKLEGCFVQCPAHGLRFNLATGSMRNGGLAVTTYPTRIVDGLLEILLPD